MSQLEKEMSANKSALLTEKVDVRLPHCLDRIQKGSVDQYVASLKTWLQPSVLEIQVAVGKRLIDLGSDIFGNLASFRFLSA